MKIIMVAAISIDGRITRANESDVSKWTSPEDKKFFFGIIAKNNLIVMGSGTYEVVKKNLVHASERLRVVMTRHPEKYEDDFVKGQLEFTDQPPAQLIDFLSKRGFKQMLLLGGSQIYGIFLKENLVNELYLTVEPKIFGTGKSIVEDQILNINMKLFSTQKLNSQGALLLKYRIQ